MNFIRPFDPSYPVFTPEGFLKECEKEGANARIWMFWKLNHLPKFRQYHLAFFKVDNARHIYVESVALVEKLTKIRMRKIELAKITQIVSISLVLDNFLFDKKHSLLINKFLESKSLSISVDISPKFISELTMDQIYLLLMNTKHKLRIQGNYRLREHVGRLFLRLLTLKRARIKFEEDVMWERLEVRRHPRNIYLALWAKQPRITRGIPLSAYSSPEVPSLVEYCWFIRQEN